MSITTRRPPHPELSRTSTLGGFSGLVVELAQLRAERSVRLSRLWAMTPEERRAAMWRGDLTGGECAAWAAHAPEEVPLIGGEWAFIAMHTPEWAEGAKRHPAGGL